MSEAIFLRKQRSTERKKYFWLIISVSGKTKESQARIHPQGAAVIMLSHTKEFLATVRKMG